jgi:hypothetical protein
MSAEQGLCISTLLTRNLHDVFGENDPGRRRAAIREIFTEDWVFYDPSKGVYRGRDAIDRIAGAIKATHPDFRYQPIAEPEELGNGGRIQRVSGRPGDAPASPGLISSLPRTVGLPPFISFSTSYLSWALLCTTATFPDPFLLPPQVAGFVAMSYMCSARLTRKPDRAWCQQVHDQPVAVEATGDEAKSEAQCERTCREIGAAVARPRSREIRCPQQPFLSRCSTRVPARD